MFDENNSDGKNLHNRSSAARALLRAVFLQGSTIITTHFSNIWFGYEIHYTNIKVPLFVLYNTIELYVHETVPL